MLGVLPSQHWLAATAAHRGVSDSIVLEELLELGRQAAPGTTGVSTRLTVPIYGFGCSRVAISRALHQLSVLNFSEEVIDEIHALEARLVG